MWRHFPNKNQDAPSFIVGFCSTPTHLAHPKHNFFLVNLLINTKKAHIGAATQLQAKRMFIRFFPDSADDEAQKFADIVITKNVPISMADLQGFFLFFKHDKDSAKK